MKMREMRIVAGALLLVGVLAAFVACWNREAPTENRSARGSLPIQQAAGGRSVAKASATAQTFALPTNQTATVRGTRPFVLTANGSLDQPVRLAAEALGMRTLAVLSRTQLLVEAVPSVRARLSADKRFKSLEEFMPTDKIEAKLLARLRKGEESVEVSVLTVRDEDRAAVIARLEAAGGEMLTGCLNEKNLIRARLSADLVASLAGNGDVRWMEGFDRPHLMNDLAVTEGAMNVLPVWNTYGLSGEGQNVSTSDSGIDTGDLATLHEDLRDRVKDIQVVSGCSKSDVNGHGTHTAGSIVGNGTKSSGKIRGVAWGAHLYAWFCGAGGSGISLPSTTDALFTNNGKWPAFLHSASWGSNSAGAYTSTCLSFDGYVWENPTYLPVISAGNAGSSSQTIGSPAASKNVLAVAATQNLRSGYDGGWGNGNPKMTANYSSRGPCATGRIKPDIAAPGTGVLSTRSYGVDYSYGIYDDYYAYDTGTSMACPLTAGSMAVVRQWLVEKKGFDNPDEPPTAALMKAVITGGATGNAEPNNNQGWGRINLENTLFPADRAVKLVDRIPFAPSENFTYIVETTNAAPLDVQLVWLDYPGSALVNDLDLTVETVQGGKFTTWYGNGGTSADTLNTLECVRISSAEPTKYVITVKCKHVVYDYTNGGAAALYIRGAFDPDATPQEPELVRIKERGLAYMTLDKAFAAVQAGETIEITGQVPMRRAVTVPVSCTLVATNATASLSPVVRESGAGITVAGGATLTVSNVVFNALNETLFAVAEGGCVKLCQDVSLGVDLSTVAIRTTDATGLEVAGALGDKILLSCEVAKAEPNAFGKYSCALEVAKAAAEMIVCADDAERETRGNAEGGILKWRVTSVPVDESAGYFVDGEGVTNAYARINRVFERYMARKGEGGITEIVVRKAIDRSASILTNELEINTPLTLRGATADAYLTPSNTACFTVVEDGTLVITNLIVRDYLGPRLFAVKGGDMVLASGAVLTNLCTGMKGSDVGGVTALRSGSLTMCEGARILDCQAKGEGDYGIHGGGIYADGGTLKLQGGTIQGCRAFKLGGGVYVWRTDRVNLELSGKLQILDNVAGSNADNLYIASKATVKPLLIADEIPLGSHVGIGYSMNDDNATNAFATITNTLDEAQKNDLARAFSFDGQPLLYAGVSESNLVWKTRDVTSGECDPLDAYCAVVYGAVTDDSVYHYYRSLDEAFAYMTNDCTVLSFAFGWDYFEGDITVPYKVVLMPDPHYAYVDIHRTVDSSIKIPEGASLTISNVYVYGYCEYLPYEKFTATKPLFDVAGGALTLAKDSSVQKTQGSYSWGVAAVNVWKGGTFTMEEGAFIDEGKNYWLGEADDDGYVKESDLGRGGGLLLNGGKAYLKGGYISNCSAKKGAAVYVANGSVAYISGSFTACQKNRSAGADKQWDVVNNIEVDGDAMVMLDGELTGDVGITHGTWQTDVGSNVFGRVKWDGDNLEGLLPSAAKFFRDDNASITATIVTNDTEALLVWTTALTMDGTYTDDYGRVYRKVGAPVTLVIPSLSINTVQDVVNKLDSVTWKDQSVRSNILAADDPVGSYTAFKNWAGTVVGGDAKVLTSTNALISYAFGCTNLFEKTPNIQFTDVVTADGQIEFTISVKDGEDAQAVASEKVAEMFEASSNLSSWDLGVQAVTDETKSTSDQVRFKVTPGTGKETKAFLRLKW